MALSRAEASSPDRPPDKNVYRRNSMRRDPHQATHLGAGHFIHVIFLDTSQSGQNHVWF
jgi:hypothetical protein